MNLFCCMVHPVDAPVGGADEEGGVHVLRQLAQVLQLPLGLCQSCVQLLVLLFCLTVSIEHAAHAAIERGT